MKLYLDNNEYCDAEVLAENFESHHVFGQSGEVGRDVRIQLRLSKHVTTGAGDTRRFELREGSHRRFVSPLGTTDSNGIIEALAAPTPPWNILEWLENKQLVRFDEAQSLTQPHGYPALLTDGLSLDSEIYVNADETLWLAVDRAKNQFSLWDGNRRLSGAIDGRYRELESY